MKRILLLAFLLLFLFPAASLAHSGRTDSSGGHYDRSTGEYHYHHGYSAHQHPGGVCPYSATSSSGSSGSSGSSSNSSSSSSATYYDKGYEDGFEAGSKKSENSYDKGNKDGYEKGKKEGYENGYNVGYSDGSYFKDKAIITGITILLFLLFVSLVTRSRKKALQIEEQIALKRQEDAERQHTLEEYYARITSLKNTIADLEYVIREKTELKEDLEFTISSMERGKEKISQELLNLLEQKKKIKSVPAAPPPLANMQIALSEMETSFIVSAEHENDLLHSAFPFPDGKKIGKDGLPADTDAIKHWGKTYTVYLNERTHTYHRGACRYVNPISCHPVHILSVYQDCSPCNICKPEIPDMGWYFGYMETRIARNQNNH